MLPSQAWRCTPPARGYIPLRQRNSSTGSLKPAQLAWMSAVAEVAAGGTWQLAPDGLVIRFSSHPNRVAIRPLTLVIR